MFVQCFACTTAFSKADIFKIVFPKFVGDGKIVLEDEPHTDSNNGPCSEENGVPSKRQRIATHPVDLELEVVLGKMPRKVVHL